MSTDELREAFLDFFVSKGCDRKPSDLLVPANDPTLLFTGAGMNQFKEQFLGIGPVEFTAATTCQKCIRTGDIENVGKTRFHMTFFEMLGNFSFGGYFKREAIHWGWEFVTKVMRLPADKINVTVYLDDDEAYDIWTKEVHRPAAQVRRCDEADNFWPASAPSQGPDGVCGPCSEIYVDLGNGQEVEIWNLVFTQFNRVGAPPDNLRPLPKKNIDTGMGLERAAAVVQGVPTAHDIDIFRPLLAAAQELTHVKYDPEGGLAAAQRLRRIAEHARSVTFCMHEGVRPSPEKQGFVVRRLLRRAVLDLYFLAKESGRDFDADGPLMHRLVPAVVEAMRKPYPELAATAGNVAEAMRGEEEQFRRTVETGLGRVENLCRRVAAAGDLVLPGADVFDLLQTYGFPAELTTELAAAKGFSVDRAGFDAAVEKHQAASGKGAFAGGAIFVVGPIQELKSAGVAPTEFVGYAARATEATVKGIVAGDKLVTTSVTADHPEPVVVVLDRTPFYGESGGQVGDTGELVAEGFRFEVIDTQKSDGYYQHIGHVRVGTLKLGQKLTARLDAERRAGIERAHSATHILHAALHKIVGDHARQAGSRVAENELRFDFSHGAPVKPEQLRAIEDFANAHVMAAEPIAWNVMPIEEARKLGAMALFGEKYGDQVRVVTMGGFSREFCGGCHLDSTGKVGALRVVKEEGVAAGVRRVTALVGPAAVAYTRQQEALLAEAAALLRSPPPELPARIAALQSQIKDLQAEAKKAKSAAAGDLVADLLAAAAPVPGGLVIVGTAAGSTDDLRQLGDQLRAKAGGAALATLLASADDSKVTLVASVGKAFQDRLKAGDWVREASAAVDGKGGGRPDSAQGGGKSVDKLPVALAAAKSAALSALGG